MAHRRGLKINTYTSSSEKMFSRTRVRRNALNHPGFTGGSDSHNRKRSLDAAAWSRSEKRNNSYNDKEHSDGVSLIQFETIPGTI